MRSAPSRASSRLFMAATMACETWSIKGIMSDILVD
jgi:hypothetical protein